MLALDAHRIFLSTVTAEFARYRTELATRFHRVSVKAVFQEEFEYHDTDLVEKLYRARLFRDPAALAEAAHLIRTLGYARRTAELAAAQAALENKP
jgi:hypothetical protein